MLHDKELIRKNFECVSLEYTKMIQKEEQKEDIIVRLNLTPSEYSQLNAAVLIQEGADLHGVLEVIFSTTWSQKGCDVFPVVAVYAQESQMGDFMEKLGTRCSSLANCKVGGIFQDRMFTDIAGVEIKNAKKAGAEVVTFPLKDTLWSPTITKEYMGPNPTAFISLVISLFSYRSPAEAVKLVNHSGLHFISLWGSDTALSLALSEKLNCDAIWINCHGLQHPTIPVLGKSGFISGPTFCYPELPPSNPRKVDLSNLHERFGNNWSKLISKWTEPLSLASYPNNINVLIKCRQPRGEIVIDWTSTELNALMHYLVPTLACGNKVVVACDLDVVKDIKLLEKFYDVTFTQKSEAFENIVKNKILWGDESHGAEKEFWKLHDELPSDRKLLGKCMYLKYVWLPSYIDKWNDPF